MIYLSNMNDKKIRHLLGMKDIHRLPNTPHHRGYNLLEHSFVVGMLFRWFASEENISYDINVFEKVLMHDFLESVTGDLNHCVKSYNDKTREAWHIIEKEICNGDSTLSGYSDEALKESMTHMQFLLFKMCDILDLWIFCKNEEALGNNTCKLKAVIKNCEEMFKEYSNNWTYFKSILKFIITYEG